MSSTALSANAVTYVPHTRTFYVGAIEGKGFDFEGRHGGHYEPIAKLNLDYLPGGKKGVDRNAQLEYVNTEMVRQAERYANNLQGATDATSLANLTRVELLTEIINRQYKNVYLINGVRKVPVPKLRLDFDIQIHIKRRGKGALVPKRQRVNVEAPQAVQASFDIVKFGKLARMIDTTDEDELSALISPMSTALEDLAQIMSQDENLLIADAMDNNFHTVSGHDWGAYSSGASTNNPLDDITSELERIVKNHGRPGYIAMNMSTFGKYLSNLRIRGLFPMSDRDNDGGVGAMPGYPGLTRIIDTDLPYGKAYIWDMRALSYGEGPMVSESFRDPERGVSGHVIRKWVQPLVPTKLGTDWTTELTGVAT